MLLTKMRNKYGIKADVDRYDNIIKQEVDNLIANNKMTETGL